MGEGPDRVKLNHSIFLLLAAAALAGCAKKEEILQGQRFDIRTPLSETYVSDVAQETATGRKARITEPPGKTPENRALPISLPRTVSLSLWTHRNGNLGNAAPHLRLGRDLTRLWSAPIGAGNDARHRITSGPVIAEGLIYTLDSQAGVTATSPIGATVWRRDLTPPSDRPGDATGGGLAYAAGVIYATTGFGEVVALKARDGSRLWTQKLDAPVDAPPLVWQGRVYVISRDNQAWAIRASDGRIQWQQQSTPSDAGLLGGASAAADGRLVILPFSSGEVVAAMAANGLRAWSVAISGGRSGYARADIGDISGDPVVKGGRVYVANQAGRMAAIDARDGTRIWTANQGSYGPVLPVGNSVFLVSDEARLLRLSARDGSLIWSVPLPQWRKAKKRFDAFVHYGPILAGGRLLVASSDGKLRSFDPVSGKLLSEVDIPGGAASAPAIVDGVLYVLSQNGKLHAFK